MFTEHAITLNIVPGDVPPVAHVSQYDVGREIRITLLDGSKGFELSPDYSYTLVGTKSSGRGFSYDDILEIVNNALVFKTTGQMTVVDGPVVCGIIIMDGDEHVETLSFILEVHQSALTTDTIIDSDDFHSIIQDEVRAYLERTGILIDRYLRVQGAAADAKATSDALALKVNKPVSNPNGESGQFLRTNGDGTTIWADAAVPTDEKLGEAVQDWLDNHPDATLNIEDGSIMPVKLSDSINALLDEVNELDENYAAVDFENVDTAQVSTGFARRLLTDQGLISDEDTARGTVRNGYLTGINVVGDSITAGTIDGNNVQMVNIPASQIVGSITRSQIANGSIDLSALTSGVTDEIDSALSIAGLARQEIAATNENLSSFESSVTSSISDLQDQIDGAIETWFYSGEPSSSTEPEVNWTTTDEKNNHLGDLYYDSDTGYCYRYQLNDGSYEWHLIADSDISTALAAAAAAQDTADSKRRVFYTTPTPPYDQGDLWVQGSGGDILRCQTAKAAGGIFAQSDWVLASKYTDDTVASQAYSIANGKSTVYYQATEPTGSTYITNDIWFETDNDNKMYSWDGTQWVPRQFDTNAIAAEAITADQIASRTITASQIQSGTITGYEMAAETITAREIKGGTITTNELDTNVLNADNIHAGTLTGIAINNGDGTFSVDSSGNLKATNAQLTGSVRSIDPEIEYWYYTGAPASNKPPESDWTTTELKTEHLGDIYADMTSSTYVWYRYTYENNAYVWVEIPEEEAIQTIPVNSVFSQMHGGALTWYDSKRNPIHPLKGYIGFKDSLGSAEQDDYFLHINHAFDTDYDFDSGYPGGIKLGYYGGTSDPHMTLTLEHNTSHRPFICEDGLTVNGVDILSDIGTSNLVSGTNFKDDIVASGYSTFKKSGWRSAGTGTGTITKISVDDGTLTLCPNSNIKYGWRITCDVNGSETAYSTAKCVAQDDINAIPGKAYTMSCYARLVDASDSSAKIHMFIGRSKFGPTEAGKIELTSTDWVRVSATHSIPTGDAGYITTAGLINAFFGVKDAPHGIDICGMKVEFGSRATDWSPAPFDSDNSNLEIGGRNLFINTQYPDVSSVEKYPNLLNSSANTIVSSGTKTATEHGLRVTSTGATRPSIRFGTSVASSATMQCFKPGKTYTWSFDAKWKALSGTLSNTTTYYMRAYLYTDAETTGTFAATAYETVGVIAPSDRGTEMSGRCEFTFTVPSNTTIAYLTTVASNYSTASAYAAGDYLELSNLKLEEGNKATAWSPALEDAISYTDKEISDVETSIDERSPHMVYENDTPLNEQSSGALTLLESIAPYNLFTVEIEWNPSDSYNNYRASTQVYVPDGSTIVARPSIVWYGSSFTDISAVGRSVTINKSNNTITVGAGERYGYNGAASDRYAIVTHIIAQSI